MKLPDTDVNQVNTPCPTAGHDMFSKPNRDICERYVHGIQGKLDKAVADGNKTLIRSLIRILCNSSKAVRILAVYKICEINRGRYTAGVDGMSIPEDRTERRKLMEELVNTIDIRKTPSPIRRVYIPKPNGDKRPLGIPTITDRIIQEIIRISIEPICEYHFQNCSHGFRPKRSCHDAIQDLYFKLSRKTSCRWVVEGDIKGCFDNIKHDHIILTLNKWDIPSQITNNINKMLKAGIMENLELTPSTDGTPQGGVISPMLANVALTALDNEVKRLYGRRTTPKHLTMNPIVRYADDFVIIAQSQKQAKEIKAVIKDFLRNNIGLELSDEKTHITNIDKGFNFLGFHIKKYNETLLIRPSKENIKEINKKLRFIFDHSLELNSDIGTLIHRLNPVLRGWANYYRHVVSKKTFRDIAKRVWDMTAVWIKKTYPTVPKRDWRKRFFTSIKGQRWVLCDKQKDVRLFSIKNVPIMRHIKIKGDVRVYNNDDKDYWEMRDFKLARDEIFVAISVMRLFKKQQGRCAYCKRFISQKDISNSAIHQHHLRPRSEGGDWKSSNLRLLHAECHTTLHSQISRQEMAKYVSNGIDYLRLLKPNYHH